VALLEERLSVCGTALAGLVRVFLSATAGLPCVGAPGGCRAAADSTPPAIDPVGTPVAGP